MLSLKAHILLRLIWYTALFGILSGIWWLFNDNGIGFISVSTLIVGIVSLIIGVFEWRGKWLR